MERRGLASASPKTSPRLAPRKGCLCLGTEALPQPSPCQAVLVFYTGRLRVAVTPHRRRSRRIPGWGLVDLEAPDIAARRKERGEDAMDALADKIQLRRTPFLLSQFLVTHLIAENEAGHPKWLPLCACIQPIITEPLCRCQLHYFA